MSVLVYLYVIGVFLLWLFTLIYSYGKTSSLREDIYRQSQEYEDSYSALLAEKRQLENNIDAEVERRLEIKVREWFPDSDDIKADWDKAEQMAEKRKMIEAKRFSVPRKDQDGEPAKVSQLHLRRPPRPDGTPQI